MYVSLATTHRPATDLGFLLMKHPGRLHEVELSFGRAVVLFPEATSERCEAVLMIDVDPVGLVRGRGVSDGLLDQYVNDRPYAASSFLSVALNRVYRSAMAGTSRERAELAATAIPLEITVKPLPVRGSAEIVHKLFEPLGWTVESEWIGNTHGRPRYASLTLRGSARIADALSHLYVLIPVLDDDKHYWVGDDEVEKLLVKGDRWLASHPERDMIARRYLKGRRNLVRAALSRLVPEEEDEERSDEPSVRSDIHREEVLERPLRLHDLRLDTVTALLADAGVSSVADLGCGEGKLLERLIRQKQFTRLIGLDASARSLERAADRLKLGRFGGRHEGRLTLLHGALTYRDERWHGVDAAALVEVVEHLDPNRLPALVEVVFGAARPKTVVITTPNVEYNALFEAMPAGTLRHPDHRFEWTRAEFKEWAATIEREHSYRAAISGIGDEHPVFGPVSQVAVFTR